MERSSSSGSFGYGNGIVWTRLSAHVTCRVEHPGPWTGFGDFGDACGAGAGTN